MHTVQTHPGNNASTFLTHLFGQGLDDDRYRVERFRSMADGDIRPLRAKEAKKSRSKAPKATVSRQAVQKMRPARDEIIIATGINLRNSGVQYWGCNVLWRNMLQR